jgi:hypothetical protein
MHIDLLLSPDLTQLDLTGPIEVLQPSRIRPARRIDQPVTLCGQ